MNIQKYAALDFKNEYKRLMSLIPDGLKEALRAHKAIIAGGAITSLFTNNEVNDLDVYFRSWIDMESFLAHMHKQDLLTGEYNLNKDTNGWTGEKRLLRYLADQDGNGDVIFPAVRKEFGERVDGLRNIGMTDKSVMYAFNGSCVLQVIAFDVFPNDAEGIFNKFDWTINMGCFDFSDDQWKLGHDFLKHNAQRMLHLNTNTEYPIISLLRVGKYVSRGYKISKKEMLKLGVSIGQLSLSSWEDCKKHLSGMYGTNVDELFSDTEDFSIDSLFDKLDDAENKYIDSVSTDEDSEVSYADPLDLFYILQRLRKNTGRFYISKLWAVCRQDRFFLMDKKKDSQVIYIGCSSDEKYKLGWAESFSDVVNLFYSKDLAVKQAEYVAQEHQGSALFEASVGNPYLLSLEYEKVIADSGADVKLDNLIEIYGELDE